MKKQVEEGDSNTDSFHKGDWAMNYARDTTFGTTYHMVSYD